MIDNGDRNPPETGLQGGIPAEPDPSEEIISATLISGPPRSDQPAHLGQLEENGPPEENGPYVFSEHARNPDSAEFQSHVPSPTNVPSPSLQEKLHRSPWFTAAVIAVVMGTATTAYLITSVVSMLVAMWTVGEFSSESAPDPEAMNRVMQDRLGIFVAILPPQLSLLLFPVAAAFLMPEGPRRGLRLVRGRWPIWVWFAAAAGTPLIGLISSLLVSGFAVESESLKMFTETFRIHGQSGFLIPIALLIGLAPAICEELLFRGFLQPRLTRLVPPGISVFIASALFAIYHLDPVHVIAVFPLGLWLGFLSYRSGSLFPAMIGHFVNNVLSVVSVMAEGTGTLDVPDAAITIPILVGGGLGLLGVIYASLRWRVEPPAG